MRTIHSICYPDFAHWDTKFPEAELHTIRRKSQLAEIKAGDIIILHGGTDIDPAIYGAVRDPHTQHSDNARDDLEVVAAMRAFEVGAFVFGICRGAQLLCALNGGTLKQHIYGHGQNHLLRHMDGRSFPSNSCHHQMMQPVGNYILLAQTDEVVDPSNEVEPEIVYWPNTKSYGVQGHPEWLEWNHPLVQLVINESCDLWGI